MSDTHETQGYSLAELMFVVTILGILVIIAVASFSVAINSASAVTCKANRRVISSAVEMYFAAKGVYPSELSDLDEFVHNWNRATRCPTGPSLTLNGVTHAIVCPVHGQ